MTDIKFTKSMILGSMMGDGHVNRPAKHVINGNYGLGFTQNSLTEEEYIYFKHKLCNEYFATNKVRNKHNNTLTFDISMKDDTGIVKEMINLTRDEKFKRKFPDINSFDVVSLLFWYLDDGSLSISEQKRPNGRKSSMCRRLSIHLKSYDDNDIFDFTNKLNKKFNLNFKFKKCHGKIEAITIRKLEDIYSFLQLMKPYVKIIPKSMHYKFCMCYSHSKGLHSEKMLSGNICNFHETGYCKCRDTNYIHLVNESLLVKN